MERLYFYNNNVYETKHELACDIGMRKTTLDKLIKKRGFSNFYLTSEETAILESDFKKSDEKKIRVYPYGNQNFTNSSHLFCHLGITQHTFSLWKKSGHSIEDLTTKEGVNSLIEFNHTNTKKRKRKPFRFA